MEVAPLVLVLVPLRIIGIGRTKRCISPKAPSGSTSFGTRGNGPFKTPRRSLSSSGTRATTTRQKVHLLHYETNQHTSPVWGGLQTAFSSSFENASLDRAISMESIRELAKRTVQKPINEGLLKVGDSQFMEKFKQRAASSNGNTADG